MTPFGEFGWNFQGSWSGEAARSPEGWGTIVPRTLVPNWFYIVSDTVSTNDSRRSIGGGFHFLVSIYLDSTQYTKRNSFVGLYVQNLRTQFNHLFCVYRKEDQCHKLCGCRGWCTLGTLLHVLVWSLQHGADGLWPTARHDGTGFNDDSDAWRQSRTVKVSGHTNFEATTIFLRCFTLGATVKWK